MPHLSRHVDLLGMEWIGMIIMKKKKKKSVSSSRHDDLV